MSRFAFRRMTAVFVLIAVLGVPLSTAAAPRVAVERVEDRPVAPAPFFTWVWYLLVRAWTKEGCLIDPNGRCIPGP